jgi:hypothetical protein
MLTQPRNVSIKAMDVVPTGLFELHGNKVSLANHGISTTFTKRL